jgi:hypothetical protein
VGIPLSKIEESSVGKNILKVIISKKALPNPLVEKLAQKAPNPIQREYSIPLFGGSAESGDEFAS